MDNSNLILGFGVGVGVGAVIGAIGEWILGRWFKLGCESMRGLEWNKKS